MSMLPQAQLISNIWTWHFMTRASAFSKKTRSEEHTSELQSQSNLVCRLLLEKKMFVCLFVCLFVCCCCFFVCVCLCLLVCVCWFLLLVACCFVYLLFCLFVVFAWCSAFCRVC